MHTTFYRASKVQENLMISDLFRFYSNWWLFSGPIRAALHSINNNVQSFFQLNFYIITKSWNCFLIDYKEKGDGEGKYREEVRDIGTPGGLELG